MSSYDNITVRIPLRDWVTRLLIFLSNKNRSELEIHSDPF